MRWILLVLVLLPALAEAKGKGVGEELLGSVEYVDAGVKRRAWLDPKAIVEFSATAAGEKAVRGLDPKAVSAQRPGTAVRLWRLSVDGGLAVARLAERLKNERFARVYRDAPSTAGRARALTGNLVLRCDPKLGMKLISARKLQVLRTLPTPATWVVKTPAGKDPLAEAQSLAQVRGVLAASAEWWLEVAAR